MINELEKSEQVLENLRRLQLKTELISYSVIGFSICLIIWILGIAVEMVCHLSSQTRWLLLLILTLCSIASIAVFRWRLRTDYRIKTGIKAQEYWALEIGRFAPQSIKDRLLNALQINRRGKDERVPQSDELAKLALKQIVAELPVVNLEKIIDRKSLKFSVYPALCAVFLLLFFPIIFGSQFFQSAERLISPNTEFTKTLPFTLTVEPAGGWGYRNEAAVFKIQATGEVPDEVYFQYRFLGGDFQIEKVKLSSGQGMVSFSGFPNTIYYLVRSGDVSTPEFKYEIITRPQIAELQYKIYPPQYTNLPVVIGRENVGDIEALPGSQIELKVRSNKPLSKAWFQYFKNQFDSVVVDSIPIIIKGNEGKIEFNIKREGCYSVRLLDKDGHRDIDPVRYRIRLLSDEFPTVRITFPEGDVILGEDMILPLAIMADDDYGISRILIEYRNFTDSIVSNFQIPLKSINLRSINVEHLWYMGNMSLMPGDALEYWAVVYDNDNVRGPKRGESERKLVRLPTFEEIVSDIKQSEEKVLERTEKTLETAKQLRDEVTKIAEELKRNPNVDWQRRKQIEEAVSQQQDLNTKVEQAKKALDELVDKLEKNEMLAAETLEKYMELQKLLSEVLTPELKAAMDKLKEALESQDPEKIRQALEQFDQTREQFLQSIERSLNILKQLQLERKLDELVKRAEELLHTQEHSLEVMETEQKAQIPFAQEMIAQAIEMFKESILETSKMAASSGEGQLAETLDSLQISINRKDLIKRSRQIGSDVERGDIINAMEKGQQLARDLAELQNCLKRTSSEFKERRKKDLAFKLRRLVEELLIVSETQEEIINESQMLGTQSPRYRDLVSQQSDVRSALQGTIEKVFEVSRETFFISPQLGAALGKAIEETSNSILAYTDRNPRSAFTYQKRTLGEINRSTAELLSILNQLEGSKSSTGFEEMMQRLSEMASAQQSLNQQSMPIPGMGGEESMLSGETLSRLAAQQRALQQAMEQAAAEAQGMKEILGNLDGIAEAMAEVAKDFEDQKVDERTRRLQRQIVNRLLDATRSAREQEYSRKRESRTGVDVSRKSPAGKIDLEKNKIRLDLLKALQEGYTPDYRKLIRDYYNALEQLNYQP